MAAGNAEKDFTTPVESVQVDTNSTLGKGGKNREKITLQILRHTITMSEAGRKKKKVKPTLTERGGFSTYTCGKKKIQLKRWRGGSHTRTYGDDVQLQREGKGKKWRQPFAHRHRNPQIEKKRRPTVALGVCIRGEGKGRQVWYSYVNLKRGGGGGSGGKTDADPQRCLTMQQGKKRKIQLYVLGWPEPGGEN